MDSNSLTSNPSVPRSPEELKGFAKDLIEQRTGRQFSVLHDFDWLATEILQTTHTYISPTTLRRFWGYQEHANLRPASLDVIAAYLGYSSWKAFADAVAAGKSPQSGSIARRCLMADNLDCGTHIELRWPPERRVVVRYEGCQTFSIVSVEGSKLRPGGVFRCMMILENEPLYLASLTYPNSETEQQDAKPTDYVCGQTNGVQFKVI